jgi:hypothetical protein
MLRTAFIRTSFYFFARLLSRKTAPFVDAFLGCAFAMASMSSGSNSSFGMALINAISPALTFFDPIARFNFTALP